MSDLRSEGNKSEEVNSFIILRLFILAATTHFIIVCNFCFPHTGSMGHLGRFRALLEIFRVLNFTGVRKSCEEVIDKVK